MKPAAPVTSQRVGLASSSVETFSKRLISQAPILEVGANLARLDGALEVAEDAVLAHRAEQLLARHLEDLLVRNGEDQGVELGEFRPGLEVHRVLEVARRVSLDE